jgi:hypothetical protein
MKAKRSVVLRTEADADLHAFLSERIPAEDLTTSPDGVCVWGERDLGALLREILDGGFALRAVNTREGGIEDYYLSMIGGGKHA